MTQAEALDILKMGKNVFLTGAAGSGKTHVINEYVKYLKSHAVDVAVTASTGIAATHIGGMTIHSWSGLGIRDTLTDYDIDDLMQRQYIYRRFEKTKVLVIDEVSMLHHFRLDLIEWICRQMKHNDRPFGGMQIVLCGDFFQLPPVTRAKFGDSASEYGRGNTGESEFAYKAEVWSGSKFTICYLSEQHRQKDNIYLSILNEIRQNAVTQKTVELLKTRLNAEALGGGELTRLYTHNIDVDVINNRHLDLIKTAPKQYAMSHKGSPNLTLTLKKSCLSPEMLVLKVGARVMFTKNQPVGDGGMQGAYVNGTLGVISSFNQFGDPVVRTLSGMTFQVSPQSWKIEEEGKVKAEISQLPLRLAWAITVHKSQGMSLDAMEVDLSKSFVRGMGYVALSRVRSLGGMKLLGFNDMSLQVDPEVLERDREFQALSVDAVEDLQALSRAEITEIQSAYLKKIEPDEKTKVKQKEYKMKKEQKKSTQDITAEMLSQEMKLNDIADARVMQPETIISHIEDLVAFDTRDGTKNCPDFDYLKREFKRSELDDIRSAFATAGSTKVLAPVYNILMRQKKKSTYLKIRLARLFLEE